MIQKTFLDNGIRVITEDVPGCHSVSLGIWVNNGSRHETAEQAGISHFIEHMLFKGTSQRTAQSIASEIDSVGGILNGFTGREESCYYVKVLDEKLPMAFDLLGDLVCNSLFDLDEIEKERRVILQEIAMVEDNPEEHIHDQFAEAFWANHPLGLPVIGSRRTIAEIDRPQMRDFMAQRYVGRNLIISAVGSVEHAAVLELANAAMASIAPGREDAGNASPRVRARHRVETKDLEQTHVCLGVEALPQSHPDRYAVYVLNTILGGNMSSRLFQRVREEQGLAYSVYSYNSAHSDSGALILYAGTSAEEAPLVVRTMLHEMNVLRQFPVSADELQAAKDYLKGSLTLSMESTDNRMTRLAKNELYLGRHVDLADSKAMIDRITIAEIQELAGRLFREETLNLQVVGRVTDADFPPVELSLG